MSEWEKIAKFMGVPTEEIYEEESNNNSEDNITKHNYSVPIAFVEHLHDYIKVLKEEIQKLKNEKNLKS